MCCCVYYIALTFSADVPTTTVGMDTTGADDDTDTGSRVSIYLLTLLSVLTTGFICSIL